MESFMNKDTIRDALGINIAMSPKMKKAIRSWYKAYIGESEWIKENVKDQELAPTIASEIARLVTVECKLHVSGSPRAVYIDEQLTPLRNKIKEIIEVAGSIGGIVLKPYISNSRIMIDFIYQDEMFPFSFDGAGNITGIIFPSFIIKGKTKLTRLEIHHFAEDKYIIENKAYVSKDTRVDTNEIRDLGKQIPLKTVVEWKDLKDRMEISGLKYPLFSYLKVPLANNIDRKSPLGISVYARAMNDLEKADIQAARIDWEYESKETAIDIDENMLATDMYGNKIMPKGKEKMYRTYHGETFDQGDKIKYYSPTIRDQSFYNGYNNTLKAIEFKCHLAYGTLSDPNNVDKTAEEIKASKQRSWQLVSDFQNLAEKAITRLVDCMDSLCTIEDLAKAGKVECTCNWNDSIIADADKEKMQDMQDVNAGLMQKWEYRVKWYGETEKQAKKMLGNLQVGDFMEDE